MIEQLKEITDKHVLRDVTTIYEMRQKINEIIKYLNEEEISKFDITVLKKMIDVEKKASVKKKVDKK